MNIYLIDYENVNEAGLAGVRDLLSEDQVHIFYSERIKTIPFSRGVEMTQSKASIEFIEIHKTAKNYLDFQLSTYLGFLIGKGIRGQVFIISKDAGFDSVVDFWKGRNINICRRDCIAYKAKPEAVKPQPKKSVKEAPREVSKEMVQAPEKKQLSELYRKKIRAAVKEDKLAPSCYTTIYKSMVECDEKLDLNNALVKAFGSTAGGTIYGQVKPIFEEYKK